MTTNNFLLEIGTEELPAANLKEIIQTLEQNLVLELTKADLSYSAIQSYATPRRLAIIVSDLPNQQKTRVIEKKGPAVSAAFDGEGKPTAASIGFAKSCQVEVSDLEKRKTDKGEFLYYSLKQPGLRTQKILPEIINNSIQKLPIPKPMRWGNSTATFLRPVHWIVAMLNEQIVPINLFHLKATNKTYGHRFLHPQSINLKQPQDYKKKLAAQGKVIADWDERKEVIRLQILKLSEKKGTAIIDESLLNEVTNLVEWPVAILCKFDKRFLDLPPEVLISAMKTHQRYFHIVDESQQLVPYFIAITNIESKNTKRVIAGNERVMRARLSDAEFFFHSDLKHNLEINLKKLNNVIFQKKLGTLYDKTQRIKNLAESLAKELNANVEQTSRAALFSKTDLISEMVGEFPELQGMMGYYYALKNNETLETAKAIRDHYLPRHAKDKLPENLSGCLVSIADRIDTIAGIFAINEMPTGEKDPYALRRAALGLLRIIIDKQLPIDLKHLIALASQPFSLANKQEEIFNFIMERLRAWYLDQGITADVYAAVMAKLPTQPFDFHLRLLAVQHFCSLPQASSLAAANKRVSNIVKKENISIHSKVNPALFQQPQEYQLEESLTQKAKRVEELCNQSNYTQALIELAELQKPIDDFFDHVMVMVEDEKIRNNRLALLMNLRNLFLLIADISLLQL